MFAAYCDESYGGDHRTTPYYVVAGFCGPTNAWERFETYWKDTMRELRITQFGLHASKCANGAKPYHELTAEQRREIQHRMIVDIRASRPLMGVYAAVDMKAFRPRRKTISDYLGKDHKKYNEPHVIAMRSCVQLMAQLTEDAHHDKLAFIFDRNKEFGRRAFEWYNLDVRNPLISYHTRLGPFTEDDRMISVGLQAADLLAYSAYRHLTDSRDRWQWTELNQAAHIVPYVDGETVWSQLSGLVKGKRLQDGDSIWDGNPPDLMKS